jgi:glycoside/pentoside/hexuronide:cation symporter, GPH family
MHKPDKVFLQHAKFTELIQDKNFLRMMISFFVVNCGLGLNSALALYYYKNYLEFTESQTQIVLISFLFVFTLSIPFWIYMTRHFSKRKLIISSAFLLGCLTIFTFPNYKGIDFWLIVSVASGVGGVLVGVAVVLEIYLSDFIKDKEIKTQQNVSGQYLGVWKMSSKISRAVAIALAGPILEVAHNTQVLANYFGWGVGLFFILAALVMAIPIKAAEL